MSSFLQLEDVDAARPSVMHQGWKFMIYSHCQELGQQANWLLIIATHEKATSQKPGQEVDPTLDNDYN